MFCRNCGNPVGEGEKFCVKCGTRVEVETAPAETAPAEPEVKAEAAAPVEKAPESPAVQVPVMEKPEVTPAEVSFAAAEAPVKKKRKWKKKAIVAGIVAASLTVTSTLAALFVPEVGNFFAKTFMSSENYFAHVQKNNAETLAADVASLVSLLDGKAITNLSGTAGVDVVFGEGMKELISQEGGAEAAAMLSWIQSLGMQMDMKMDGNVYGIGGALRVNGSDLANVNAVMDLDRGYAYLSVPQLNSQAIRIRTGISVSSEEYQKMQALLARIADVVPEEKVLEDMLKRYITAISEQVKDVNEKSETIKAGGVSQKVTCMDVKITQKLALNVTKAVLKEARNDKDLKAIFKKVGALAAEMGESIDAESMWDEMVEGIDEMLDELAEVDASSEKLGTLKFWVNGKGEIVGVGFKAEEAEIKAYIVEKGDKFGLALTVDAPDQNITFDGSGTISGGKRSGTFALRVQNNEIVKITLSDVDDAKFKEQGLFSGKIVIEPSESISGLAGMAGGDAAKYLKGAKIELTANTVSEYEGTAELAVYLGGKHFATLKANAKAQEGSATVDIPSSYVNADRGSDMERWAEGVNLEQLLNSLKNVGAPNEMMQAIEGEMNPTAEEEVGNGAIMEEMEMFMPSEMPTNIRIPYNAMR